ncbi:bactofilin family protein [Jejubacter calystegiae]|nr:polymer-forming cytoskeletal protein [Jejubacter calystegiae]
MFNFNKGEAKTGSCSTLTNPKSENRLNMERPPAEEGQMVRETIITPGVVLRGSVSSEVDIIIDGTIEGDVSSQKSIRVDGKGNITGNVVGRKVTINGYLKGSCRANIVVIMEHGRVEGDIFAHELSIERGGVFIGGSNHIDEMVLEDVDGGEQVKTPFPVSEQVEESNIIMSEFNR